MNNIFTALARRRNPGIIREFVLWCATCFIALLALIASAVGHGNVAWIFLMIFSIGMGVMTAFRLTAAAMLYGVCVFNFLVFLMHYFFLYSVYTYDSKSILNMIFFILLLVLALAIIICAFVHFFSRYNLGKVLTVLVIIHGVGTLLLNILMFAAPCTGDYYYNYSYLVRRDMNYRGYWIGTICFWMMLTVIILYYIFFFGGMIENKGGKIYVNRTQRIPPTREENVLLGIQGLQGMYAGQEFHLHGSTVTIGSAAGVTLVIADPYVSKRHCAIRFNTMTGDYEVFDNSTNGTYLSNGVRLKYGVYNQLPRRSIIYIGSQAQQFRLM